MTSSIVRPPDPFHTLQNFHLRISRLEQSDGSNPWINVANDSSDPLWTPDSPPWENGWSNLGSPFAPVSFKRFLNWVHIRGGFTGGANNTVVFTLPETYWPAHTTPLTPGSFSDYTAAFTLFVDVDGTVNYVQEI